MRIPYCSCILLVLQAACLGGVTSQGRVWTIENDLIRVRIRADTGAFSVLDKRIGHTWTSVAPKRAAPAQVSVPQARQAPTIDANLNDWPVATTLKLTHDMVADAKHVKGPDDLSATVRVCWHGAALYLAAQVRDDKLRFGRPNEKRWWDWDSIEFWIGGKQCALRLNDASVTFWCLKTRVAGVQAKLRRAAHGYVVEARVPLAGLLGKSAVGKRFPFAIGINDADAVGGKREGQLYFPRTWRHSAPDTFATAVLTDTDAKAPESPSALRHVKALAAGRIGIRCTADCPTDRGASVTAQLTFELPENAPELVLEIDLSDKGTKITSFRALPPLPSHSADAVLLFAPSYGNGLAVPVTERSWRGRLMRLGDLPLPWIGLIDRGKGYIIIGENPDDMNVRLEQLKTGGVQMLAPSIHCRDCKGAFRYARRIRYAFIAKGGIVAAAKCYRQYAKQTGLLKTLKEKMKTKPHVARLQGAPDIWGNASLQFCREAKAAGIDRAIVNGGSKREHMEAIKKLGYLISKYDDYEDCIKGRGGAIGDVKIPDDCTVMANGKPQKGWVINEKTHYMKRCTALQLKVAKRWIPKDLAKRPYNARFLDVTTAASLRECYSPVHPLTRAQDREARRALARYMGDELGLVLGGETGRWWGADIFDYWEGMQGGGPFWSWPAGRVGKNLPQTRKKIGKRYLEWGLGQRVRVPLWELCFGDCVVSTWYWGESTGHIHRAAPELAAKQDAFNILYGTVPLYWVSRPFSFNWKKPDLRARLLESYRNTCKLHEVIGFEEMVDFAYATPDKHVQRTRFADGTAVTVNFGSTPYVANDGGKAYRLPQFGFFAKGPRIFQYRALVNGRSVTEIRSAKYLFCDGGGKAHDSGPVQTDGRVTLRQRKDGLMINVERTKAPVRLRPARCVDDWRDRHVRLLALNAVGDPAGDASHDRRGQTLSIRGDGIYRLVYGPSK